jgi:pimeloyl-ACP methyl ester carboxylesterase
MLPGNYSIRMESEAIKLTFDSLGIKEPVVLVGHSFGGLIALDFAITHPDYIHSLVLIEPPVFGIALARNESPAGMKKMQDLIKDFTPHADITEQMVKDFRCSLMNCDEFDIHEHPLWHEWVKQKNRLRGLSVINDYQIDMNALHKFSKPVLIITGTQTVQFHQRIDELLTGEFSNVKTGSLDGGHTAVNANPTGFIELLLNFLK